VPTTSRDGRPEEIAQKLMSTYLGGLVAGDQISLSSRKQRKTLTLSLHPDAPSPLRAQRQVSKMGPGGTCGGGSGTSVNQDRRGRPTTTTSHRGGCDQTMSHRRECAERVTERVAQ